ncbi:MAG: divergent polysaccharide deacetylase family protein [Acetobacter sp.]
MHSASLWQQMPSSGRLFVRFWGGCAVAAGVLAIGLQIAGPPPMGGDDIDVSTPALNPADKSDIPGLQADLLEKRSGPNGYPLPRRGQHGHVARQVYAAPAVDVPAGEAQIALVVTGVGDARALTDEALTSLPGAVSLVISPYAPDMKHLLEEARANKHETLLSLPIQPNKGGAETTASLAGPNALGSDLSARQNLQNYQWALSSLAGYVGVTNAAPGANQSDFTHSAAFSPLLDDIDKRGLLYLNATPNTTLPSKTGVTGTADIAVNTDTDIVNIDIQLLKLQQAARRNGRAIGVMGPLRPVALACLRAWIPHLKDVGITLVPVSMLVAPVAQPQAAPPSSSSGPTMDNGAMRVHLTNPRMGKQQ